MIKASYAAVCLCTEALDSSFETHGTKGPSTHFRPDESKPQNLKNHLTAISYRSHHHHPSSCRSKVPPPPPHSPPLRAHTSTQTDQSVQEVRPGRQTAELSSSVKHMERCCVYGSTRDSMCRIMRYDATAI